MNLVKKLFLAAAIFFASSVASLAVDIDKLNVQAITPTVQLNKNCSGIMVYSDRDKESGEVKTLILTAKHCIVDKQDLINQVYIPVYDDNNDVIEEKVFKATVLGVYYKADLGILQLKDKNTFFENVAKLAPEKPNLPMGNKVYTVGYPLGLSLTVTEGLFGGKEQVAFPDATKSTTYYRATPNIVGGNSGGGLYEENKNGDLLLLGITSAVMRDASWVAYYTPVDVIHDYLKVAIPELYKKPDESKK